MDLQELQRIKNKFDIIGNDAALTHAIKTALDLAVLITGESGVGKDVIPRIIHQNSLRKTGKYLAVNCGAIPEGTINAELFGHEKGAFTGAIGERKGYFEEANGGTLFLDEIGELPKETQALLLRVLQNGEYLKVGSSKVEKTDVRVIAATNINLAYAVATGKFREDLYYRLSGIQIKVPALRDRNKDDQYLLFRKFSSDFAEKYNLCKISLSHDAISMLTSYRWPGNIRQLKNVAETVTALESKPMTPGQERIEISADRLEGYIPQEQGSIMVADGTASTGSMNSSEKEQIVKAIFLLKQEVDRIKERLESMASAGVVSRQDSNVPRLIEEFGKSTGFQQDADFQQNIEHTAPEEEFPKVTSMEEVSDLLIKKCLAKHDGKVKAAAEELGISERTIYRKLAKMKQK